MLYRLFPMVRALFRGRRVDDGIVDELHFHLERETDANIARGMSPADARRAASVSLGRVDDARARIRHSPGARCDSG
jgi:putative ABC transport system permease protein